ncbi:hypothetical protein ADICYQ_4087 [Cyclobacterium qasimii M12-11B]|uniref:Uncharacterized protein n=1 Tax=Cyclobacterium qasimii M12-11B TaxID=641524 RepID=S7VA57_9BACT|nr:hypothetical protein ADICYQ_4087 [Cyclobacterium qasimii M12-11B]
MYLGFIEFQIIYKLTKAKLFFEKKIIMFVSSLFNPDYALRFLFV